MAKRYWSLVMVVAIASTLLMASAPGASAAPTRPAGWTGWNCHADFSMPVEAGTLNGSGCTQWNDSTAQWQVKGTSSNVYDYAIFTSAKGYDECTPYPWVYQMVTDNIVYYNTSGDSGVGTGGFQNCYNGHSYENDNGHYSKFTSTSSYHGGEGYWYY